MVVVVRGGSVRRRVQKYYVGFSMYCNCAPRRLTAQIRNALPAHLRRPIASSTTSAAFLLRLRIMDIAVEAWVVDGCAAAEGSGLKETVIVLNGGDGECVMQLDREMMMARYGRD